MFIYVQFVLEYGYEGLLTVQFILYCEKSELPYGKSVYIIHQFELLREKSVLPRLQNGLFRLQLILPRINKIADRLVKGLGELVQVVELWLVLPAFEALDELLVPADLVGHHGL